MIDTSDIDITLDNLKRIGFYINKESNFAVIEPSVETDLIFSNNEFTLQIPCETQPAIELDLTFDNTIEIENFIKHFT